ncbi:unnamed protein product [Allacma fusca]|uniref:4-alpha-hydroxy-tetrahydropterin dehydratase n=1 Tax=Allacma fusca TaxID=39272 RepID=A0A8J2NTK6_9HEXA|nr:unnamed protein product [Allacma fusca]
MVGAKQTARLSTGGIPRQFKGAVELKPYLQWIDKSSKSELFPLPSKKTGASVKRPSVCLKCGYRCQRTCDAVNDEIEVRNFEHQGEEDLSKRLGARDAREFFFARHDRGWIKMDGEDGFWKEFIFASFNEAWSFMSQTVEEAMMLNRYPDWHQAYNTVTVTLPGSLCSGISLEDATLAEFMETISDALTK